MGVSVDNEGRGRRKDVNAELVLVPYIDLLTCMVAFLLMTAIWTQLARLEVQQKGQGESGCRASGAYDFTGLGRELKRLKEAHPDKSDVQILSEDAIKFDVLVRTMDAAMAAGFPGISLQDSGGGGW